MAKAYSPREIDQLFKASDERSASFHQKLMSRMDDFENNTKDALARIEEQTTKTNGSVAEVKRETANLRAWRTYTVGFIAGLALAFGILAFFVGQVFVPIAGSIVQNGNHL